MGCAVQGYNQNRDFGVNKKDLSSTSGKIVSPFDHDPVRDVIDHMKDASRILAEADYNLNMGLKGINEANEKLKNNPNDEEALSEHKHWQEVLNETNNQLKDHGNKMKAEYSNNQEVSSYYNDIISSNTDFDLDFSSSEHFNPLFAVAILVVSLERSTDIIGQFTETINQNSRIVNYGNNLSKALNSLKKLGDDLPASDKNKSTAELIHEYAKILKNNGGKPDPDTLTNAQKDIASVVSFFQANFKEEDGTSLIDRLADDETYLTASADLAEKFNQRNENYLQRFDPEGTYQNISFNVKPGETQNFNTSYIKPLDDFTSSIATTASGVSQKKSAQINVVSGNVATVSALIKELITTLRETSRNLVTG